MKCKDCIYFIKYYEEMYNEDDPDSIFKTKRKSNNGVCINGINFKFVNKNNICNSFKEKNYVLQT